MKTLHYFIFLGFLVIMSSCGAGLEKEYEIKNIDFTMEGPLFEGPNSASVIHTIDFGQMNTSMEKVKHAKLSKIVLYVPDTMNFDRFSDFKFQLTADAASMIDAAQINPVPAGKSRLELVVSEEADLTDFFRLGEFIFLVDGNLKEDVYDNLSFKADIQFKVNINE
jgi:hypothetical protein